MMVFSLIPCPFFYICKTVRSCKAENRKTLHTQRGTSPTPSIAAHATHSAGAEVEVLAGEGSCATDIICMRRHTSFLFLLPSKTSPSELSAMVLEEKVCSECRVSRGDAAVQWLSPI